MKKLLAVVVTILYIPFGVILELVKIYGGGKRR